MVSPQQRLVSGLLVLLVVLASGAGCRLASNRGCERAIALLRAEKIDLEDRYYRLEAELDRLKREQGFEQPAGWQRSNQPSGDYLRDQNDWSQPEREGIEGRPQGGANGSGANYKSSNDRRGTPAQSASSEVPEIVIEAGDFSVRDRPNGSSSVSSTPKRGNQVGKPNTHDNVMHQRPTAPTQQFPAPNASSIPTVSSAANSIHTFDGLANDPPNDSATPSGRPIGPDDRQLARFIDRILVRPAMAPTGRSTSWLIVQPVDKNRQALPLPADIKITLIDPSRPTGGRQLGHWSYDKEEVSRWIRDHGGDIPGIHLPPPSTGFMASLREAQSSRLLVGVRYVALDGRIFTANREISTRLLSHAMANNGSGGVADMPVESEVGGDGSATDGEELEWQPHR